MNCIQTKLFCDNIYHSNSKKWYFFVLLREVNLFLKTTIVKTVKICYEH